MCNSVQWVGGVPFSTSTARAVQLLATAQGATAFQECEPLRMLSAMGFRQNSGATMRCKQGAGGLPEADCCALTSLGKWWRLRNGENIPIECDVLTDCLTPTTAAA